MKTYVIIFITIILSCLNIYAEDVPAGWRKIYVSNVSGNDSWTGTYSQPVKTLVRAKTLASSDPAPGFAILLKGGENFTPTVPMTNQTLLNLAYHRYRCAFIWDIAKDLLITTYGNTSLAVLGPGTITGIDYDTINENALQHAIGIAVPYNQDASITIENLDIKTWELGAFFIYAYQPDDGSRLTIRNNLIAQIGTHYFPTETFLEPGTSDLIYAAEAIQAKDSHSIDILGNCFYDIHNKWDECVEDLHVFYINNSWNSNIKNNVIFNASGTPVKAKDSATTNLNVWNNAFMYAGPSLQLGFEQTGFVRCHNGAHVNCSYNWFYSPYCWNNASDAAATAVADVASGSSEGNITWVDNTFFLNYRKLTTGSHLISTTRLAPAESEYSRRYYNGSTNSFVYLTPASWSPGSAPYIMSPGPVLSLMDFTFDPYYLTTNGSWTNNNRSWTINSLLYTNYSDGGVTAWGTNGTDTGWLLLLPQLHDTCYFWDDFSHASIPPHWTITYSNTSLANWWYTVTDNKLWTKGITPISDVEWTTITLSKTFTGLANFHLDFRQEWIQNAVAHKPYFKLILKSGSNGIATIGYQDSSATQYGTPHCYTYNNGQTATGTVSQTALADWDVDRINGNITVYLNGQSFATVTDTRTFDKIELIFQGKNMKNPEWTWWGYPRLAVDLINIEEQ